MRHTFIPDANDCKLYYLRNQTGGTLPGFHGARIQRGYGLGSFFKSIARVAIPLVKKGVNALGKKAVETAVNVGQDVLEGKSVKQAVASRGRQAVNDLAKQGVDNIKRQIGGGSKRKRTNQPGPSKRLKTGSQKKVVILLKQVNGEHRHSIHKKIFLVVHLLKNGASSKYPS